MSDAFCKYCYENPISPRFWQSCDECMFTCPSCSHDFPYENGHGDCTTCDDCCAKHGDDHWRYA